TARRSCVAKRAIPAASSNGVRVRKASLTDPHLRGPGINNFDFALFKKADQRAVRADPGSRCGSGTLEIPEGRRPAQALMGKHNIRFYFGAILSKFPPAPIKNAASSFGRNPGSWNT